MQEEAGAQKESLHPPPRSAGTGYVAATEVFFLKKLWHLNNSLVFFNPQLILIDEISLRRFKVHSGPPAQTWPCQICSSLT